MDVAPASPMPELSAHQMKILEELYAAGFRPVAISPYESALCVRRGECAAILAPVPSGGLKLLAPPAYLIEGNLSVMVRRGGRDLFVWKHRGIEATPERRTALDKFRSDLTVLLERAITP